MAKTFSQLHNEILNAKAKSKTYGVDRAIMIELDPNLYAVYTETEAWMNRNHPEVGCNSSYANCVDFQEVFSEIHGMGYKYAWGKGERNQNSDEIFVPTDSDTFNRKVLLSMYFPTELIRLDYARDIRSAGDCDNSGLDSLEVAINRMMTEVLNA